MLSVLMPAYNAEKFLESSVYSVLEQTFDNFELLVVDDCSSDATPKILSNIKDPRLRVIRNVKNLGVVGALNRAAAEARGSYFARIDADDLCFPTRFAKQIEFLERNPNIFLLGTATFNLEVGRITPGRSFDNSDPTFIRWSMHLTNPIVHPSVMFRADLLRRTKGYLIEEFEYAEDFEFIHRVLKIGDVAALPERLVIYRLHEDNLNRLHRDQMIERGGKVLARAYADLLGREADTEAQMVARHVMAKSPVRDDATLDALGSFLETLVSSFVDRYRVGPAGRERIVAHACQIWWGVIRAAARAGHIGAVTKYHRAFRLAANTRIPVGDAASSVFSGLFPAKGTLAPILRRMRFPIAVNAAARTRRTVQFEGVEYVPAVPKDCDPPRLFVVVDTEAEFDWDGPFARNLTRVDAVASQESAQAIFDRFGLRPIYVVDYAVASQPRGYEPLRRILARGGCAIGAHLHTWTNPPFEEDLSSRNSHGGNLPPDLEERKLRVLVSAIEASFGVTPRCFKAGRYGIGPHTSATLARLGFLVDFSILPRTDLRGRGGPDFRAFDAICYRVGIEKLLSVPMTRNQTGLLAPLPSRLNTILASPLARSWRIPGILAKLKLANMITLTPEGVSLKEQLGLLRSMLKAGRKTFVLHYHSPSLVPGNTPYVRTPEDLSIFLDSIDGVCDFFFHRLGGLPGNPDTLLRLEEYNRV
jgi:hypothetical protein